MLNLYEESNMDFNKELNENILSFWLDNAIDYKNGGIYTCLDEKGKIYGTDKSVWFQGRSLWTFSKAYNISQNNENYLKAANNIYNFLSKCTDYDGRMYFSVTEDGKELQKRRYYFSETFAAIGCTEYYKATGDKNALLDAEKYFKVAYECFKGIRHNIPKINSENRPCKSLSPVMIMLSTAQVMRSVNGLWDKYNIVCKECLDEILYGGYLIDDALLESISLDGKFIDSPTGRVVNPGHSLEAAWFIMTEGLITKNIDAVNSAKKIIDVTIPIGLDKKHGGIIAFTDILGKPPVNLEWDMKLWWPQCEAMIALRLAHLIFGDEKYLFLYNELLEYCKKYFVDEQNGEWYGYLHYDNTCSTTLKGNMFKGPFHIPRFYMIMDVMDKTGSIEDFMK